MNKKNLKKSLCLLTVWLFLLNQFAYASFYEDMLGLPYPSQTMPIRPDKELNKISQIPYDVEEIYRITADPNVSPAIKESLIKPCFDIATDTTIDTLVRRRALQALGNIAQDPRVSASAKEGMVNPLLSITTDNSEYIWVRVEAVGTLGIIALDPNVSATLKESMIAPLLSMATDKNIPSEIRGQYIIEPGLGRIAQAPNVSATVKESMVKPLLSLATDQNEGYRARIGEIRVVGIIARDPTVNITIKIDIINSLKSIVAAIPETAEAPLIWVRTTALEELNKISQIPYDPDPGFEEPGPGGWLNYDFGPQFGRDYDATDQKHSGNQSLKLWATGIYDDPNKWEMTGAKQIIPVKRGDIVGGGAWVKYENLSNVEVFIEGIWLDANNKPIGTLRFDTRHIRSGSGDWVYENLDEYTWSGHKAIAPRDAAYVEMRLVLLAAGTADIATGTVWYDDAQFTVTPAKPYEIFMPLISK